MGKSKNTPVESRLELKLPKAKPETMLGVVKTQVAAAKNAPDLPNQPAIQAALNAVSADVAATEATLGSISTAHATLTTLISTRTKQLFGLRMDHEALQTAINVAGKGDKAYLETYGGTIVTKGTLTSTADPPANATLKVTKLIGEACFRCKADRSAYAYAYQWGNDPTNLAALPQPTVDSKASYTVTGLTPGQKVYGRIAIYRRGTGQGQWSPVMMLIVP